MCMPPAAPMLKNIHHLRHTLPAANALSSRPPTSLIKTTQHFSTISSILISIASTNSRSLPAFKFPRSMSPPSKSAEVDST